MYSTILEVLIPSQMPLLFWASDEVMRRVCGTLLTSQPGNRKKRESSSLQRHTPGHAEARVFVDIDVYTLVLAVY